MAEFDPYHKWLGIPPEEQPPNHYRLLGLTRFESDPEVIESAAEGRMVLLRTRQSGPNSADSQRLLNEVAFAQRCLLDPAQRAAYDQQLAAQQALNAAPAVGAAPSANASLTGPNSTGPISTGPISTGPSQAGPPQTAPPRSAPPRSIASEPEPVPVSAAPVPIAAPQAIGETDGALESPVSNAGVTGVSPYKRRRRNRWFLNPALIGLLIAGVLLLGVVYALTRSSSENGEEGSAQIEQEADDQDGAKKDGRVGASDGSGDGENKSDSESAADSTNKQDDRVSDNGSAGGEATSGEGSGSSTAQAATSSGDGAASSANGASGGDLELTSNIWKVVQAERVATSLNDTIEAQPDQSYFVHKVGVGARTVTFETLAPEDGTRWIRMEPMADDRLPANGPGWNKDGNFVLSTFRVSIIPSGDSEWQSVVLKNARADFSQDRMPPDHTLDKQPQSGWAVFPEVARNHQLVFELAKSIDKGTPVRVEMVFAHRSRNGYTAWVGRFRISFAATTSEPPFVTPRSLPATNPGESENGTSSSTEKATTKVVRRAAPDDQDVNAARGVVREAIPPPESQAADALLLWSEQLLQAASDSKEPAEYYAITSEARRAATMAGDARFAFAAIDAASQRFEIDATAERIETLKTIAKRAQSAEQLDSLLLASEGLALDLMADDQYEAAADLLDEAYQAFQRRDSDWHIDMTSEMRKYARRQVRADELAAQAAETLKSNPDDGGANATMGMWQAVYHNDFDQGLAYYRKGSDSVWKKLADAEAGSQADPKSLGDQWWDAAQRKDKETQAAMLRRAAHWYEKALPRATAISKAQMTDRLNKIRLLPTFAASKQATRQIRVGEGWDLLPLVQMPADVLDGSWVRRHETVETVQASSTSARIRLPINLQGAYTLAIELTAVDGGGVQLALPAGSRGYQVLLGANKMSGIQYIGGLPTPQNRIATPSRLTRGKRHSVLVRFSSTGAKGRIDIRLDKRPYLVWEGDLTKLDDIGMLRGAADGITIGAMPGARVKIHSARLQLLSGSAERLRDEQPFRIAQPSN